MQHIYEIHSCYLENFMIGTKNEKKDADDLSLSWRKRMEKQAYKMGAMIFRFNKKFPEKSRSVSSIFESLENRGVTQAHLWLSCTNFTPYKAYEPVVNVLKSLSLPQKRRLIEYLFELIRLNKNKLSSIKLETFDNYLGPLIYSRKSSYDVKNFLFETHLIYRFFNTYSSLHRFWNSLDIVQFYFLLSRNHKQSLHENPSLEGCNLCQPSMEFLRKIVSCFFSKDKHDLKFKSLVKELGTFKCRADSEIIKLLIDALNKDMRRFFLEMVSFRKVRLLDSYEDQFWILYNRYGSTYPFPVKFFLNFRKVLDGSYVDAALLKNFKDHREFISAEDELDACYYSELFNKELLFHLAFYFKSEKAKLYVLSQIKRKGEFWRAMTFCSQWSRHWTKPVVKALLDRVPDGYWWDETFRPELERIVDNIPSSYLYSLYKRTKSKSAKDEILRQPMPKTTFESILRYLKKQSAESALKFEKYHVNNIDHNDKEPNLLRKIKHPLFEYNSALTVFNTYPSIKILKALSQKTWGNRDFDDKINTVLKAVQNCNEYADRLQISEHLKSTLIERLLPLKQVSQNIELCKKLVSIESVLTEKSIRIGQSDLVGVIRNSQSNSQQRIHDASSSGVQDGDTIRLFWSLVTRGNKDLLAAGDRLVGKEPLAKARSAISNKMRLELYKWAQDAGVCKDLSTCSMADIKRLDGLVQLKMRESFIGKEIILDLIDQTESHKSLNDHHRSNQDIIDIRFGGAELLELLYNSKDVGCCYYPGGVRENNLISWLLSPDTLFLYLFPYSKSDRFTHPLGVVMAYFINNRKTLVIDSVEGKHITLQKFQNWERSVMDAILKAAAKFDVDMVIINESVGNHCPKEFVLWCDSNRIGVMEKISCNIPQSLDAIDKEWSIEGVDGSSLKESLCRVVTPEKSVNKKLDNIVQNQFSSDRTINDAMEVRL